LIRCFTLVFMKSYAGNWQINCYSRNWRNQMTEQYRTIGPKIKGYFVFTAFWLMCLSSMITKIIFKRFITIRPGLQKGPIRTLYLIHKVFWLDDTEVLSHHFFLNVFPSKLWLKTIKIAYKFILKNIDVHLPEILKYSLIQL
jgi:hypothetical protein